MPNIQEILESKGTEVVSISPKRSVYEAVGQLVGKNIGSLLVVNPNGSIAGIITERDILRLLNERIDEIRNLKISEIMTQVLYTLSPDDDLNEAMNIMTEKRVRHLPVLDGDRLAGIVSIGDVVKRLMTAHAQENVHLRRYITDAYPS